LPLKLVITNQKGGVAKTTTCLNIARCFADDGKRVLLVDTDPQGQVAANIGLKKADIPAYLGDLLTRKASAQHCIIKVRPQLDIIASDRTTMYAEGALLNVVGREMTFRHVFEGFDDPYDLVILDTSPTITMMQTCALVYAERYVAPITMDILSLHGAVAMIEMTRSMNELYKKVDIRGIAFLPVMVDRRLGTTYETMQAATEFSQRYKMEVLSPIRTDQAVIRTASRRRGFLSDAEPKSKALEDYRLAAKRLAEILDEPAARQTDAQATA